MNACVHDLLLIPAGCHAPINDCITSNKNVTFKHLLQTVTQTNIYTQSKELSLPITKTTKLYSATSKHNDRVRRQLIRQTTLSMQQKHKMGLARHTERSHQYEQIEFS